MAASKTKKKKYGKCPTCDAHKRPNVVGASIFTKADVPPWLQKPREVDDYPQRQRETDQRHAVEFDKILAKYDFRGNDWRTTCCYGHEHAQGLIVETVCGIVLAIGHECGENTIEGLKSAAKHVARADAYFGALGAIDRILEEVPSILPTADDGMRLLDFRREFARTLPHVVKALREDATKRSFFYGTGLWVETPPGLLALHAERARLRDARKEIKKDATIQKVQALQRKLVKLDADARAARRWYDGAIGFASDENLKRIVGSFGVGATVSAGVLTMSGATDRPMQLSLAHCGLRPKA